MTSLEARGEVSLEAVIHYSNSAKLSISLVAMMAWLLATNQCAVGASVCETEESHTGGQHAAAAHHHGTGDSEEKHSDPSDRATCCKQFDPAIQTSDSSLELSGSHSLLLAVFACLRVLPRESPSSFSPRLLEHAPPRFASVTEIVFQRCVLSHAPPALG